MPAKIAVYTAVFGRYEKIKDPSYTSTEIDYFAFTDYPIKSKIWKNIVLPSEIDSTRAARKIKILGHEILRKYERTIWIDGNIDIKDDVAKLVNTHKEPELITFKHPQRSCIYDEAVACITFRKDDPAIIRKQIEFLHSQNYPENNGLIESNVLIRKNSQIVSATMSAWWEMVANYSKRDQLSFNYAAFKCNLNYEVMAEENARGNSSFFEVRHDHESFLKRIEYQLNHLQKKIRKLIKSKLP